MGDTDNTSAALALGQTKLPNLLVNSIGKFRLKRRLIWILINNVISHHSSVILNFLISVKV
jgi:hypothetical protein